MDVESLRDSAELIGDPGALRAVMREDGVVFLRGVLDPTEIESVRDSVMNVLDAGGWTTDPNSLQATAAARSPGQPGFGNVYKQIQSIEAVHRFVFDSPLPALVGSLFDEDVFVHPGKVVRVAPPDPDGSVRTQPHQDFAVLQTTSDTITCWWPMVSCPPERGGLMVRPGSHRGGYVQPDGKGYGPYPVFLAVGGDEPGWATTTFEPGDVLLFHGLTVHASLPNTTTQFRLSMEARFQSVADPIMAATLRPNRPREIPDWPSLTDGWSSTAWVEAPPEVEVVRPPAGTTFDQLLRELTVPPSRFVDSGDFASARKDKP